MRSFPQGFLWGTSSAAHQVEGDNRNCDWWEWEQKPGKIANGDTSAVACDHYHRYREDFALLREAYQALDSGRSAGTNRTTVGAYQR